MLQKDKESVRQIISQAVAESWKCGVDEINPTVRLTQIVAEAIEKLEKIIDDIELAQ